MYRFLDRVWRWYAEELPGQTPGALPHRAQVKLHQVIQKVGRDLETLSYNTAVAALMELHNVLRAQPVRDRFAAESFAVMLSPLAPHLAEEAWSLLGRPPSVIDAPWPVFDPRLCLEETVEVAVQVNGKMRGTVVVARASRPRSTTSPTR